MDVNILCNIFFFLVFIGCFLAFLHMDNKGMFDHEKMRIEGDHFMSRWFNMTDPSTHEEFASTTQGGYCV